MMASEINEQEVSQFKKIFTEFDTKETGFVPLTQLQNLLRLCNYAPTEAEIQRMYETVDADEFGFAQLMELVNEMLED